MAAPVRGRDAVAAAVGELLIGVRRWVMDLGGANDELGDGVSELRFERLVVTFAPGPNEDYIIATRGEAETQTLDKRYFTEVTITESVQWIPFGRRVVGVDLFSDGYEDTAIRFRFEDERSLVVALVDTDLVLARDLHVFDGQPEGQPALRETLE